MWPNLVFLALRGVLEGTNKPQTVTAVALSGVALAVFLSPALVFGWGPLPQLGIVGAALATALAAWFMVALIFPHSLKRANQVANQVILSSDSESAIVSSATTNLLDFKSAESAESADLGQIWQEVRALFKLGWPIGLTLGAEGGMFTVATLLIARFGADVLAAHNVTLQAITAVFMIPLGVSSAVSVRVGQAFGANQWAAARQSGLVGLAVSVGIMAFFAIIELLFPKLILGIFVNVADPKNAQLLATATLFLSIAALFQTVDGMQVTINGALRGLQDTRYPLLISLLAYWIIGLGVGSWLAFRLQVGAKGLWFGLTAGLVFAAGALVWRFLRLTGRNRS